MNNFAQWLVTSSQDPKKTSLAVQGFLLGLLPLIMWALDLTTEQATNIIEAVANVTFYLTSALSGVWMLYGLLRKVLSGKWSAYKD